MTSPYVTPSAVPAGTVVPVVRPPARREWWRIALSVLVVVAGVAGAGIAWIIAAIIWTGCFMGCTGENHLGGALIGVVAAVSLASGPAAVSGLYRSARWMRAAVGLFSLGVVGILLALAGA